MATLQDPENSLVGVIKVGCLQADKQHVLLGSFWLFTQYLPGRETSVHKENQHFTS